MKQDIIVEKGRPLPLGVTKNENGINFSISAPENADIKLILIEKQSKEAVIEINMKPYLMVGSIHALSIKNLDYNLYFYAYEQGGQFIEDTYAKSPAVMKKWGEIKDPSDKLRYSFDFDEYQWEGDAPLELPYHELIMYKLHVRGFTKHTSSKVKYKGTFNGIIEKIPYLKDLGINCIELMPVVEFDEIATKCQGIGLEDVYMNYWGYGKAQYLMPKAAYAARKSANSELKDLIKVLHQNGIEIILELLFYKDMSCYDCLEILRYWVIEYHIDGFHVNEGIVPIELATKDPILSRTKIMCGGFDSDKIYGSETPDLKQLAQYNDDFLINMRRSLKGDSDTINRFAYHIKKNDDCFGTINYITNNNGFTLMDLVSYNEKHNDENMEDNKDGTDENYSWNCGYEGATRRKKISELRKKQIKNAFVYLIFNQGTPMIYAGDEFANSQKGNNNAYCQDNEISWLNWNDLKRNRDIFEFVKSLITIRKNHPILHPAKAFRMMDYLSCGYPDLSFHGTRPWYPDLKPSSHILGMMYCGKYIQKEGVDDAYFYIAYNMHWESHEFNLPSLPAKLKWEPLICTEEIDKVMFAGVLHVPERSIVVLKGEVNDKV